MFFSSVLCSPVRNSVIWTITRFPISLIPSFRTHIILHWYLYHTMPLLVWWSSIQKYKQLLLFYTQTVIWLIRSLHLAQYVITGPWATYWLLCIFKHTQSLHNWFVTNQMGCDLTIQHSGKHKNLHEDSKLCFTCWQLRTSNEYSTK